MDEKDNRKIQKNNTYKQTAESALAAQQPLKVRWTKASISRKHRYIEFLIFPIHCLVEKNTRNLDLYAICGRGVSKNDSSLGL